MIFIESYPNVQHSKIEILAYRTIGVITVNLQHNLPKWVCVVVPFPPPPSIFDIYESCCVALWRQSVAAVSPRVVPILFLFKVNFNRRPHVTTCSNLVHNKAEEELSLFEMTGAQLSSPGNFKVFRFKLSCFKKGHLFTHQCCPVLLLFFIFLIITLRSWAGRRSLRGVRAADVVCMGPVSNVCSCIF